MGGGGPGRAPPRWLDCPRKSERLIGSRWVHLQPSTDLIQGLPQLLITIFLIENKIWQFLQKKSQVPGLQNPLRRTLRRPSTSCQSVQSHYAFPIHESLQSENWPLDWPDQDQQVSTGTCSTWWSCQGITTRSWSRSRAVNMSSCPARWGPNPNWFYRQLILIWMTFQGHGESPDADVVSAFISICRQ